VGEVAANPNLLPESVRRGAVRASFLIVESYVPMDEVANGLNPFPSGLGLLESGPREVSKFAIHLALDSAKETPAPQWEGR
jgi:hypothetical protein